MLRFNLCFGDGATPENVFFETERRMRYHLDTTNAGLFVTPIGGNIKCNHVEPPEQYLKNMGWAKQLEKDLEDEPYAFQEHLTETEMMGEVQQSQLDRQNNVLGYLKNVERAQQWEKDLDDVLYRMKLWLKRAAGKNGEESWRAATESLSTEFVCPDGPTHVEASEAEKTQKKKEDAGKKVPRLVDGADGLDENQKEVDPDPIDDKSEVEIGHAVPSRADAPSVILETQRDPQVVEETQVEEYAQFTPFMPICQQILWPPPMVLFTSTVSKRTNGKEAGNGTD
ncbi:hypothetical protein BJ742DRAFT_742447 [Cladochytrium replicatum]|nr:hypothetical protein BJ742DRAFT_742447 [Cladochytrium replicatum]